MTPERWQRIEQLYHAAQERDPEQRADFVAEACAGDDSLKEEVLSLLAHAMAPISTAHLSLPARLGPYEIESLLGAGGMGEVWKARDTRLGRMVALKISKIEFSRQFEREARAVAALNHPNIATLYDVGPNYFVMEYVDGRTLQQLTPRKGLTLPQTLHYAAQIADALAAAHAAGIIHRDLKPGNIMITQDGRVKVVDFGIAKTPALKRQAPDEPTFTQTAEGTIAGTVSYMSPEQARGSSVDARSDIFSFGAVLYEMLTGVRAFSGDSPMATLALVLSQDPRPVTEIAEHVPRDVETLLTRCLRKDPARRWQNMSDVKVALLDLKDDSESGRLLSAPSQVRPNRRTRSLWLAGAASLVVLAAAGWYLTRDREPEPVSSVSTPLTSYPGEQNYPSFSPDGNQVAFAWNGPHADNWDIYVKVVGEGEPLRLTRDPEADICPAWSPDGRWIAFARRSSDNRYALMLISPLGGVERRLGEFGGPDNTPPGFAWSPDSKQLVLPVKEVSQSRNGLFALTVDTGDLSQLTSQELGQPGDSAPAISPDGRMLAFNRGNGFSVGDLYVLSIGDRLSPHGAPRLLVKGIITSPAWTADGKELVFSSAPAVLVAATLKRVAVHGSAPPREVPLIGIGADYAAVSRPAAGGGSRLVWSHFSQDSNIYRLELPGHGDKAGDPQALIASLFRDVFPQYSPDGKSIAFYSARSGPQEVWICQADGSNPRQLTRLGGPVNGSPRWSPDGKQIAFDSDSEGIFQFHVISAEGGKPTRVTNPPSMNFGPNWSSDGRWLYFSSNRSGTLNIWKMPAAGGPVEQVTHNRGTSATMSPDGRFLYYVKALDPNESSLWRVPMNGGSEMQVVPRIHRYSYAVTERGIYYSVPLPAYAAGGTIEFLDPATGKHAILARTDKRLDLGVTVSPDGRYLLFTQVDNLSANLMMIENFR